MFHEIMTPVNLYRYIYNEECTIGRLYIGNKLICYTLEDVLRPLGIKVYGQTCIPAGSYELVCHHSTRFNCTLPYVKEVPNFTSILLHVGNTDKDTRGCILCGRNKLNDYKIQDSTVMREITSMLCIPSVKARINIMNLPQ